MAADPTQLSTTPRKINGADGSSKRFAKSLAVIIVAGVLGAGAHLGYDWWQERDVAAIDGVVFDGSDLASWPHVDPPAVRYVDTTTTVRSDDATRVLTTHRDLTTGSRQTTAVQTTATGEATELSIDVRDDAAFLRQDAATGWVPVDRGTAEAAVVDQWAGKVFTVSDIFPSASLPYVDVVESVERRLAIESLQPASLQRSAPTSVDAPADTAAPVDVVAPLDEVAAPADTVAPVDATEPTVPAVEPVADPVVAPPVDATAIAPTADPTTPVWQFRVLIDVESFRAAEPIAYQSWERRLGEAAAPRLEAWVDADGIVRQLAVETDGTMVTQTLVGGSATSARFDAPPVDGL